MELSPSQLRYLRGLTHHINPVVMVGEKGLSNTVMAEIERALDHHELIKVKLRVDRERRRAYTREIELATRARLVHRIGQVASFFRRNPRKPVLELPER
ncbi:MAG: ribosome assembly RNA-binding protein YhbY [Xanthomonadales bacterium]|nr:ribosome assembly RNA-binding protein YhbY [Xanthomonadales bacterium]NIN59133.1 ribosome assembly RNA-binding protein YhbY [Xanthomonadales bacterium]NIN74444.1 ribosome assembly RNA-binding protein YhbY [Xanthomonadales bacterium]NIO13247.1 ribosome assembly RNA-binding protein YhbY [Xanthomonadales bacterium]NIP11526.1 ribosome assembly RNA-binding protein YhbY [Xanthomonadales bacterium]